MAGDYDYRAIYENDDDDALFNDDSFLEAVANVEAQHLGRMTNVLSYNGPKISGSDTYGDGGPGHNSIAGGKRSAPWDGQNNNNNDGHTASGHQQVQHLSRGDNSSFWSNAEEEQRKRLRTENDMRSNWPTDHHSGQVQEERSGSVRDSQQSKGEYMAALRGSNSELWQASGGARGISSSSTAAAALPNRGGGTSGGDFKGGSGNCFKCGMEGHWSKDCTGGGRVFNSPTNRAGGGGGEGQGGAPNVPERLCPCGAGACAVRTANTEKNLGRSFYKCPLRQDEGQCTFFEWCDAGGQSGPTDRASSFQPGLSEQPSLKCICGGGPCMVLTAKTEKNMGRQFYKCPLPQQSCPFFQWCDEAGRDAERQISMTPTRATNFPGPAASPFPASSGSAGCYKCGQEGHWSKDCPTSGGSFGAQSQSYNSTGGGPTESRNTGSCYKCGGQGHWSTSCPNSPVGQNVSRPVGGGGTSGGTCYKCGDPGHWANRCPAAQGGQRY